MIRPPAILASLAVASAIARPCAAAPSTVCQIDAVRLPPPAARALAELTRTLAGKGIVCRRAGATAASGPRIVVRPASAARAAAWRSPESYRIEATGALASRRVVITGSDAVGLAYGITEVAGQVAAADGPATVWSAVRPASGQPRLAIRADNPFITLESDGSISKWFYDERFWSGYLDMLARNRFNVCDIHAMYSLTDTTFPNLFPYFLRNERIPQASRPGEDHARNLRMLNRIIDMAEERGVHVALMNYSMEFPGIANGDEATYLEQTKWAVREMLNRCPRLWMFGFRIGESGRSETFFDRAYLGGIAASRRRGMRLYTRTWLAKFDELAKIGMRYPENFFIEIKYNGEHLGAPYQAIQGRWGSYSYETYLNYPRYWKVLWQVRANGTHRLFPWFDPDYARRGARSYTFGNAVGFTLENPTAYYTQDPGRVLRPGADTSSFPYMVQRNWPWFLAWGRLAYDPATPDRVFRDAFRARFGPEGDRIRAALQVASGIVPLIYRHHCLGPDHRNMAPEFETGNGPGGNIDSFSTVTVLDDLSYLSPAEYARAELEDRVNGRMTPLQAADRLEAMAAACLEALTGAEPRTAAGEWALARQDIRALAALARYYAAKDRAACALQLYYRAGDPSQITAARAHAASAAACWRELVEITAAQYLPIMDPLRMGKEFAWDGGLREIELDARRLEVLDAEIARRRDPVLGHVPPRLAAPGRDLTLRAGVAGEDAAGASVILRWQVGDNPPQETPCARDGAWTWTATIPGPALADGERLAYSFVTRAGGASTVFPGAPWTVRVTSDAAGPAVQLVQPRPARGSDTLWVECAVSDPSGIRAVWLEWKPMPSNNRWSAMPVPMSLGRNGRYRAALPLTSEGLLVAVVAVDALGNVTRAPAPDAGAPYVTVEPWDAGIPPAMALRGAGSLAGGARMRQVAWKTAGLPDRPGAYREVSGERGSVTFPFRIAVASDHQIAVSAVAGPRYGSAEVLLDGLRLGSIACRQAIALPVPVLRTFYARRMSVGEHRLTLRMTGGGPVGIEGFGAEPRPQRLEAFVISAPRTPMDGVAREGLAPLADPRIGWRRAAVDADGVVHLDAQLSPNERCYAYASTILSCERDVDTRLLLGSNDGNFVWLNGKLVGSRPGKRFFTANEDRIQLHLRKGDNVLTIAVQQDGRLWMFGANVESYDVRSRAPKPAELAPPH